MSCEVSRDSPFADSILDDSWHQKHENGQEDGLYAIAEFNAGFETDNSNNIDPQLTFSNAPMPSNHNHFAASYNAASGLDQTLSPEPSAFEAYPQDFGNQAQGTPYFHQSIEVNSQPVYSPSLQRNALRRSVSEPPGGHGVPPAPPMVFHRDNHCLGRPVEHQHQKPISLKSLPKNRPQRQHPYHSSPRKMKGGPEQFHPENRRANTQRIRHGSTSIPPHFMSRPRMHGAQYATSRVCTPAPAPETVMISAPSIGPALSESPTPAPSTTRAPLRSSNLRNMVSIPLTVDELRVMITEAVQNAVGGEEGKKADTPVVTSCPAPTMMEESEALSLEVDEMVAQKSEDAWLVVQEY